MEKLARSFQYAWQGIVYTLRTQRNMRIHFLAAVAVMALSWYLGVNPRDWAALLFVVSLVLVAEMINTAIETAVDLVTKEYHPLARIAKNVAAGAVVMAALCAVLTGIVLLGPYLLSRF